MKDFFDKNGIMIPETLITKEAAPKDTARALIISGYDKVLLQKESDFHSISVCENHIGRFLRYGISYQAGIINSDLYSGNIPYLNYFLIPFLLKPEAKNILLIGFGSGLLVNHYEKLFEKLARIDVVDIEENILSVAKEFFGFTQSEKFSFNLQDALVYLRKNRKKYDIIAVDVAGNEGLDRRFFEDEYFKLIKKSLKKNGIYIFNSCANTDLKEEGTFFGFTADIFKIFFKNFAVFSGKTSDKLYYKLFYDMDKPLLDITNCIFIASDKNISAENFSETNDKISKIKDLCPDIVSYLKDLHKIYKTK